jgi:hypothetical protein
MIGVAVRKRTVVLDIDPKNGGSRSELEQILGALPPTIEVLSGRGDGGSHLYYATSGLPLRGNIPGVEGYDIITNGYVIAPPSLHPVTGKPYVWSRGDIADELAELPKRAENALLKHPPRRVERGNRNRSVLAPARGLSSRQLDGLLRKVASAPESSRNKTLYWAACRIFEAAVQSETFDLETVLDLLAEAAECSGLPPHEVESTINSAARSL